MSADRAFLQAVLDRPEDNAPRLVYADYLDEHGDPDRAEFIRVQIELARMRPWDRGYTEGDVRCRELARRHPEWLGWLAAFVKHDTVFFGWESSPFRRGFPARVSMKPEDFVARHDELFATAPIRGVQFDLRSPLGTGYPDMPGIARLSEVVFNFLDVRTSCREVIRCLRRLQPLDHFGVGGCRFREAGFLSMLSVPSLREARSIRIGGTPLLPGAEQKLIATPFPNLRRLQRVWVPDLAWLRADWVRPLHELSIDDTGNVLAPDDTRLLPGVLPETDLVALSLGEWPLDEAGARGLGDAVGRGKLESLTLSHTRAPALIPSVLGSERLAGLRALFLTWARIDAELLRRLTTTPAGSGLRVCGLDHVTAEAVASLVTGPVLPELASLRLGLAWDADAAPVPEAVRSLLDADTLPGLVSLTLCDTRPVPRQRVDGRGMGDRVASAIARYPGAARLQELRLDLGPLTRSGAAALARSRRLEGLRLLDVQVARDDPEARDVLVERFGSRVSLDPGPRVY